MANINVLLKALNSGLSPIVCPIVCCRWYRLPLGLRRFFIPRDLFDRVAIAFLRLTIAL